MTRTAALGLVIFAVCLGLGYPTLNRYDPRRAQGTSDSADYARLVTGWTLDPADAGEHSARVLVPYLAKPFYLLARGRIGSWDPVLFGLLASNAIFCATTALLLSAAASELAKDAAVPAAALYLLNFNVANVHLSGLVDSGEACALMAAAFCLLTGRLRWLPLVGVLGALAKETFVPLGGTFALAWSWRNRTARLWSVAMILCGLGAACAAQSAMAGGIVWPWQFALAMRGDVGFGRALTEDVFSHGMLLSFGWLVPAGLWRLSALPEGWRRGAAAASGVALALAAYHHSAGSAARPIFDAAGPLLSLSAALWLTGKKL